MRKIFSFAVIAVTLALAAALLLALTALPDRLAFDGGDSYSFYVGNSSEDCKVITTSYSEASAARLNLKHVCGESATFKELDALEFIGSVGGRIIFSEELSDSVNYYCKAPLPYSVTLYGSEINLHVCVRDDGVRVASPIIFGGY